MYDTTLNEFFKLSSDTKLNNKWWEGEPVCNKHMSCFEIITILFRIISKKK